ncbi:hypothetical protein EDB85DRAFT_1940339 [Lactarius pseudohatsudake]|nr:hypothetical protein EDB85DRAFT_1940339 [Lactarius pseudohatsudake]
MLAPEEQCGLGIYIHVRVLTLIIVIYIVYTHQYEDKLCGSRHKLSGNAHVQSSMTRRSCIHRADNGDPQHSRIFAMDRIQESPGQIFMLPGRHRSLGPKRHPLTAPRWYHSQYWSQSSSLTAMGILTKVAVRPNSWLPVLDLRKKAPPPERLTKALRGDGTCGLSKLS